MCNRVPLHTVFVLLYSVYIYIYRAVCVLSCVDVIQFFTYVLHVVILDMMRECKREVRGNTNSVSQIPSQKK